MADLVGTWLNETLTGTNSDDQLKGEGGNDLLLGRDGKDQLYGGTGNDTLDGGRHSDTLEGGDGADVLRGGEHKDLLKGDKGNDQLFGDNGDDTLEGGDDSDTLDGGAGEDLLKGDNGDDTLTFTIADSAGQAARDVYEGGAGTDRLRLDMTHAEYLASGVATDLANFRSFLGTQGSEAGSFTFSTVKLQTAGIEKLDHYIDGQIQGTNGNDTITGGSGNSPIYGFNGNDVLDGASGNDTLDGGNGNDTLLGGAGDDSLLGGNNDDVLSGGAGRDTLDGGSGNDTLIFTAANRVVGGSPEIYDGSTGTDALRLEFTAAEITNPAVRADVAAFLNSASGATVTSTALNLQITGIETFDVWVDGVSYGANLPNNAPTAIADAASVAENGSIGGSLLTNDSDPNGDAFAVSSTGTFTNAGGGTITINANGSYSYSNGAAFDYLKAGQSATDSFNYTVRDAFGATASSTITFTINGVNDAPTVVNESRAAIEDGAAVTGNVLANDSDIDGDVLSVANAGSWTTAQGGTITIGANGAYTYGVGSAFQSLGAGATTADVITYTVSDGQGGSRNATLRVTVTGVNDGPIAAADVLTVSEDTASGTGNVLSNDTDIDAGDVLTVTTTGTVATLGGGTATLSSNGAYTYAPSASFQSLQVGETATDSFTYTISDGKGGTATSTVAITIEGRNDAPVIVAETAAAVEDGAAVSGNVLANDTDIDGDTLTVANGGSWTTAKGAVVTLGADGAYTYSVGTAFQSLGAGATTTESISYTVSDGYGATRTSTLVVTVTGVNDGPVANADAKTTSENFAAAGNVLANDSDVDAGDVLTVTTTGVRPTAAGASVTIGADGAYTYNPGAVFQYLQAGESATDSFTYTISDGKGGTATAIATITVTGVNDGPTAVDDAAAITEDSGPISGNLLANDSDIDGDALTVANAGTWTTAEGATVTIGANGAYTYNPGAVFQSLAAGQTVTDTIDYSVSDGQGGIRVASLVVTITGENDGPVANADVLTANEDAASVVGNVLSNDVDADGGGSLVVTTTGALATTGNGTVAMGSNGVYTYSPGSTYQSLKAGQTATDGFSYTISDGQGGTSTGTVLITITGVNDAPVAQIDTTAASENAVTVSGNVLSNDSDIDGDTLTVTSTGTWTTAGGATITMGADGAYAYKPGTAFRSLKAGETALDTIAYAISDGKGGTANASLEVTITGVNNAPNAVADAKTTTEDAAISGNVLSNDSDFDGDPLTVATTGAWSTGGGGSVSMAANGAYTYTPGPSYQSLKVNQTATDSFTYTVSDGQGGSKTATVMISLAGQNDGPTALHDNFSGSWTAPIVGNLLGNDGDPDGDTLSVTSAGSFMTAKGASVVVNADGSFSYSGVVGTAGADSFTYTISDGQGGVGTATVTLSIAAVASNVATTGDDYLVGTSDGDTINALAGNDILVGQEGNDALDGAGGRDLLIGGGGADTLNGASDYDTVSYAGSPSAVMVNLATGTGQGGDAEGDVLTEVEHVIGSDFNDVLIGTDVASQPNELRGEAGNDTLDGGAGRDRLFGGAGNDVYVVDDTLESVTELADEGLDEVRAKGAAYTLSAHVENLTYIGIGVFRGTGNAEANRLIGGAGNDTLKGMAGDDTLEGGVGDDVLEGGAGADMMIGGTGFDTASYALSTASVTINLSTGIHTGDAAGDQYFGIELISGSGGGNDVMIGDAGSNHLVGNGGDDMLEGGRGADTLDGSSGYDTANYAASLTAVTVNLATGTGQGGDAEGDMLINVEHVIGSDFDDVLVSTDVASQPNELRGGAGNDYLDGGTGRDRFFGGLGNDVFVVDDTLETITEFTGQGLDEVRSKVAAYTLGANIENLTFIGTGTFRGTGNAEANRLIGGAGDDILKGLEGNDTLGGGAGADSFVFGANAGRDVINDFAAGAGDRLDFTSLYSSYAAFQANATVTVAGSSTVISFESGLSELTLLGVVDPLNQGSFTGWGP